MSLSLPPDWFLADHPPTHGRTVLCVMLTPRDTLILGTACYGMADDREMAWLDNGKIVEPLAWREIRHHEITGLPFGTEVPCFTQG